MWTHTGGLPHPTAMAEAPFYDCLAMRVAIDSKHRSAEKSGTGKRSYWEQDQYEHKFFLPLVGVESCSQAHLKMGHECAEPALKVSAEN